MERKFKINRFGKDSILTIKEIAHLYNDGKINSDTKFYNDEFKKWCNFEEYKLLNIFISPLIKKDKLLESIHLQGGKTIHLGAFNPSKPSLTNKQKKSFLEKKGSYCPRCNEYPNKFILLGKSHVDAEEKSSNEIHIKRTCLSCSLSWTNVYVLSDIIDEKLDCLPTKEDMNTHWGKYSEEAKEYIEDRLFPLAAFSKEADLSIECTCFGLQNGYLIGNFVDGELCVYNPEDKLFAKKLIQNALFQYMDHTGDFGDAEKVGNYDKEAFGKFIRDGLEAMINNRTIFDKLKGLLR